MKTSQRSNSAHQATAKSLGNDRKLCQNALCWKVSFWTPDETKGGRKKKHIQKSILFQCASCLHCIVLVSHHLFLESQCLSHNPPYDSANVLPYDVKTSGSRHHWTCLKGTHRSWSLDYYWLKRQHWVLSDVYTTLWHLDAPCRLETSSYSICNSGLSIWVTW